MTKEHEKQFIKSDHVSNYNSIRTPLYIPNDSNFGYLNSDQISNRKSFVDVEKPQEEDIVEAYSGSLSVVLDSIKEKKTNLLIGCDFIDENMNQILPTRESKQVLSQLEREEFRCAFKPESHSLFSKNFICSASSLLSGNSYENLYNFIIETGCINKTIVHNKIHYHYASHKPIPLWTKITKIDEISLGIQRELDYLFASIFLSLRMRQESLKKVAGILLRMLSYVVVKKCVPMLYSYLVSNGENITLDAIDEYIPLRNGLYSLREYKLVPRTFENNLFTYHTKWNYISCYTKKTSNIVENFIKTIMPDDIQREYFMRILGHLFVRNIMGPYSFWFMGSGANGKTLLMNVLEKLLEKQAVNLSCNIFRSKIDTEEKIKDILHLKNKKLAVISKATFKALDSTIFKNITVNDVLKARKIQSHDKFDLCNTSLFLFTSNHYPEFKENSNPIARHIRVVKFESQFVSDVNQYEGKNIYEADTLLLNKLTTDEALSCLLEMILNYSRKLIEAGWNTELDHLFTLKESDINSLFMAYLDRDYIHACGSSVSTYFIKKEFCRERKLDYNPRNMTAIKMNLLIVKWVEKLNANLVEFTEKVTVKNINVTQEEKKRMEEGLPVIKEEGIFRNKKIAIYYNLTRRN